MLEWMLLKCTATNSLAVSRYPGPNLRLLVFVCGVRLYSNAGFHLSRALMDWMHVGHMGVCRDFCGAILFDICNEGFVHEEGTLDHKLRLLWLELRSWLQTQKKKC